MSSSSQQNAGNVTGRKIEPVEPMDMERVQDPPKTGLSEVPGRGLHMPPEVLGFRSNSQEDSVQQPVRRTGALAGVNIRARKRSNMAIKSTQSQAAVAAAAEVASSISELPHDDSDNPQQLDASLFTSLNYRGMEVLFAVTGNKVVGLCSRTHFIFQTLDIATNATRVVSITSNPYSGMIVVGTQDGTVYTFAPVEISSFDRDAESKEDPGAIFGRYRWVNGITLMTQEVFYQTGEVANFGDRRSSLPGELVDISSSSDHKILVAHRNQLAVFDALPDNYETKVGDNKSERSDTSKLLWTTLLSSNIATAKLSGDGQAIVVVLAEAEGKDFENCVRTYIHDIDDGSANSTSRPTLARASSVGILFKPGPSLKHSAQVTRISFRGLGHNTSGAQTQEDATGSDLLLTYCEDDYTVRIFNQNGWQQIMMWTSAPYSRADWVRGSSAFSLGDLESQKKIRSTGSAPPSRKNSSNSLNELTNGFGGNSPSAAKSPSSTGPTSASGAWIAEVTFRNAFPALRLSRLSCVKRGPENCLPAHFESVSAILPPGSLIASSLLNSDDMGLSIHGVWPAWNPWLSETTGAKENETLRGSAMEFLGLSSVPPPTGAFFGETYLGGTHSPPSELRVAASHPLTGKLILMEFPLWGDEDFGAMEFGSPLRHVLSLSNVNTLCGNLETTTKAGMSHVSIDFESSRLCAQIDEDAKSISIVWRKPGTMSFYSPSMRNDELISRSLLFDVAQPASPHIFHDISIVPVPLALPPLYMPRVAGALQNDKMVAIFWWPDDSFGGPPLIVALTQSGTILIFEIPPPWASLEPATPTIDPISGAASIGGSSVELFEQPGGSEDDGDVETRQEYEVMVTPHPDFGLGLRLESPMDGLPAVAGSFKKHPLNGGSLPAEKTGMIVLGDDLLSVNGVSLENLTFDDIIATVRHVGAESEPGAPLCLRFRPAGFDNMKRRRNTGSFSYVESSQSQSYESANPDPVPKSSRRTMEHMLGVNPKNSSRKASSISRKGSDGGSTASLLVGSFGECQQEFGRLIGVVKNGIRRSGVDSIAPGDIENRMLLTPWTSGAGAPSPMYIRGAALVFIAVGSEIVAKRLELPLEGNSEKATVHELGSFSLLPFEDAESKVDGGDLEIEDIHLVESSGGDYSLAVRDTHGGINLVFVNITDSSSSADSAESLVATFRHYRVLEMEGCCDFQVRTASVGLFATLQRSAKDRDRVISVWQARPDPSCRNLNSESATKDEFFENDYCASEVVVETVDDASILDFCFMKTGYLDAFPSLVVFLRTDVVVYQRRAGSTRWTPIIQFKYPAIPHSKLASALGKPVDRQLLHSGVSPLDTFPHLLPALRTVLYSYDETNYMKSDWHPESLLAYLCTEEKGPKLSLERHIRQVLVWLGKQLGDTSVNYLTSGKFSIVVPPFAAIGGDRLLDSGTEEDGSASKESAHDLMASFSIGASRNGKDDNPEEQQLRSLQALLAKRKKSDKDVNTAGKSWEFRLAMSSRPSGSKNNGGDHELPPILNTLRANEQAVLWALGEVVLNPPNFRSLDPAGQLALLTRSIHSAMEKAPNYRSNRTLLKKSSSLLEDRSMPSFLVKRQSAVTTTSPNDDAPQDASAGCVAALVCDCQGKLLDCLRTPGEKLGWSAARKMRLPFWIRSHDTLKKISEEIGQNMYRESKDILASALFFIIAGKHRTLKNLAAADAHESGKKLFKFMTSYDFSSERGRRAAEKNAFSLLSKNKYKTASAFFLLAEPPMLKSAVETIATKMRDLDLAFLVARLVGKSGTNSSTGPGSGIGSAAMFGLSGFGGGGGYAGSGIAVDDQVSDDEEKFIDWKPDITERAKEFLEDRCLSTSANDPCFSAIQLLWLGRHEEAYHFLSGFVGRGKNETPCFHMDVDMPRLDQIENEGDNAIAAMNAVINFASGPLLLKLMKASTRTRVASSILVSNALVRAGIELPSLKTMIRNSDLSNTKPEDQDDGTPKTKDKADGSNSVMSSSIFTAFDAPVRKTGPGVPSSAASSQMSSSIFDDFDAPPASHQKAPQTSSSSGQMASSIFDAFDAPAPKPASAAPSSGQMTSSIFDQFDTPPPNVHKPKPSYENTGQMTSSIFDGFHAAPTKPAPASGTTSGQMASTIFDAYDTPAPPKTVTNPSPSGDMSSSIFDSFDAPPKQPKPAIVASPPGQMTSSIFDSFDAPRPVQSKPSTENGSINQQDKNSNATDVTETMKEPPPPGPLRMIPPIWVEWHQNTLINIAARRIVRELASFATRFHGDIFDPPMTTLNRRRGYLVPSNSSQVLQFHCDGEEMVKKLRERLTMVCESCKLRLDVVTEKALDLVSSPYNVHRVAFAVLLHLVTGRVELAEDKLRNAAQYAISLCSSLSFSNDKIVHNGSSISHAASLHSRRLSAHLSWQIELCLWMHRGGALPLSGIALNEAIVAVRIGLLSSSWNRDFECIETMIRQPPDCLVNHEVGRQLWTSLKMVSSVNEGEKKAAGTTSGGWEFLVDCRRSEATDLLRSKPTGCFIIRPHSDDHGVFTLSFKTNLVPTSAQAQEAKQKDTQSSGEGQDDAKKKMPPKSAGSSSTRHVRKDDVVQHAIIRLSDSGFRCGSFGPFATLMKLLESVSSSLPFDLRFDIPPTEGVIKEEGSKPSPNSAFFRKVALYQAENAASVPKPPLDDILNEKAGEENKTDNGDLADDAAGRRILENGEAVEKEKADAERRKRFGSFLELLALSEVRKQLSCIAAAKYDGMEHGWMGDTGANCGDTVSFDSMSESSDGLAAERQFALASRMLRPLLTWCRIVEIGVVNDLAPQLDEISLGTALLPVALTASETAIEVSTTEKSNSLDGGDTVIRRMIQPDSGVDFRTLRLGEGGESAMVVFFSKKEALTWFLNSGSEKSEEDALKRLQIMEESRVVEPVDLRSLIPNAYKKASDTDDTKGSGSAENREIRYRFVDPWEVEPLANREGETRGALLGRHRFLAFSLGRVAASCEDVFRSIGGLYSLELWATGRGGVSLTKAIASVHPPWERDAGGDMQPNERTCSDEPPAYANSIRQHLYRNSLFRRLSLPQRFLALIQVELLDLKNLSSTAGSLSLSVYSLLRLKRTTGGAPLTVKSRTLDSVSTHPMKLGKSLGPNAPASWGSLVRFRFPLPEYTTICGQSFDRDREALFKGPPSVLQVSVYERKFMGDVFLGGADVTMDSLSAGGQLEEWVPLKTENNDINWFARIRLTLRFELMCIAPEDEKFDGDDELAPSVGLRRIKQLSSLGGAHEDIKKSASTPDLFRVFESIVT